MSKILREGPPSTISDLLAAWAFPDEPEADMDEPIDQNERLVGYDRMSSDLTAACDQLHQIVTDFVASVNAFAAAHPEMEWLDTSSSDLGIKQFVDSTSSHLQKYLQLYREYQPIFAFWLNHLDDDDSLRIKILATQQMHTRVTPFATTVLAHIAVRYSALIREFQARATNLIADQEMTTASPT